MSLQVSAKGEKCDSIESVETDWKMHLFRLQAPILISKSLKRVIELDTIRIYPPFEVNRASVSANFFVGTDLPLRDGNTIKFDSPWTQHPTIGFEEGTSICHGLRVDLKSDIGADWDGLQYLLDLLRERSLQWWINSNSDPFDLGAKYVVGLNEDGSMRSVGQVKDNETSGWNAAASGRRPLGWEAVVDEACWGGFGQGFASRKKLESASTAFLDGLSAYMSNMDNECIYRLCLALEIMESKIREANGKKTNSYAFKLLEGAMLWDVKDKEVIKKMFVDRGHITHGSKPYNYSKQTSILLDYLDLSKRYYERFLKMATDIGWEKLSNFS